MIFFDFLYSHDARQACVQHELSVIPWRRWDQVAERNQRTVQKSGKQEGSEQDEGDAEHHRHDIACACFHRSWEWWQEGDGRCIYEFEDHDGLTHRDFSERFINTEERQVRW